MTQLDCSFWDIEISKVYSLLNGLQFTLRGTWNRKYFSALNKPDLREKTTNNINNLGCMCQVDEKRKTQQPVADGISD